MIACGLPVGHCCSNLFCYKGSCKTLPIAVRNDPPYISCNAFGAGRGELHRRKIVQVSILAVHPPSLPTPVSSDASRLSFVSGFYLFLQIFLRKHCKEVKKTIILTHSCCAILSNFSYHCTLNDLLAHQC